MTVEELTRRWAERHRFANFHPWLSIVDDRVEFGAGQVLARIGRTRGGEIDLFFAGGESAGRARLAVAYMRPITDRQINALRRAARGWAEGERPLAMIGLAQAHLGKFDDPRLCSYRVYMADHLLGEPGFSPRDLLKGLGLEEPQPREAVEKFNPDEPRVPKGNPDGGQWTSEGGGEPQLTPIAASSVDRKRYFVDLRTQAQYGGHGWPDHVGRTDEEMIAELTKRTARNWAISIGAPAFGSFDSIESANSLVIDTLATQPDQVEAVASGKLDQAWIQNRFGFSTGREANRDSPDDPISVGPTFEVGVLIRHDSRAPNGWYVKTAYPRNERPDWSWSVQ